VRKYPQLDENEMIMMRSTSNGRMNNTWSKHQISTSKQEINQEYPA